MKIKLIGLVLALACSSSAVANELIDCTGCAPQHFQLAAMDALDGVHIVYDLKSGVSRKFWVQGVDCNSRVTTPSPDKRAAPVPYCWSGNATEMPVDAAVLDILADMAAFDNQFPGYLQNGYAKDFEFNLDSPPTGFSDPPVGGNETGHHNIVGIALDRNFSNPSLHDYRFRNFERAINDWLRGPDAPEALRGFVRLTSRINSVSIQVPAVIGDAGFGLGWNPSEYLIQVIVKDGFGNEIRMIFNPKTGELVIMDIADRNGRPFPSKYENGTFRTDFGHDRGAAETYLGLLENAGIQVGYGSGSGGTISSTTWWQVTCWRIGDGRMTCTAYRE